MRLPKLSLFAPPALRAGPSKKKKMSKRFNIKKLILSLDVVHCCSVLLVIVATNLKDCRWKKPAL